MLNFDNAQVMEKMETMSELMENTINILREMDIITKQIETSLFGGSVSLTTTSAKMEMIEEPEVNQMSILSKLTMMRDVADMILKNVRHIKEGMW